MWGLHKFHFLFEIKYLMWGLRFYSHVKNTCHDDIIFTERVRGVVKLVWYRAQCRLGDPWGIHESVLVWIRFALFEVFIPGRLCIRCDVFASVPTIYFIIIWNSSDKFLGFSCFFIHVFLQTVGTVLRLVPISTIYFLGIIKCFDIKLHLKTNTEISFVYFFKINVVLHFNFKLLNRAELNKKHASKINWNKTSCTINYKLFYMHW